MKKIYLLILLTVSMCFAANYTITTDNGDVTRIYITNKTKKDLKGFKLIYYFNSQPVKDTKEFGDDITHHYVVNKGNTSGNYASNSDVKPKSVKFERKSAIQFIATLDYSNTTIPAGQSFPIQNKNKSEYLSIELKNVGQGSLWAKSGHELRAYVVESRSGEVLLSWDDGKDLGKKRPEPDKERRIGVLTNVSTCSGNGFSKYSPSNDIIKITLDAESGAEISKTKITGSPLGIKIADATVNKVKVRNVFFKYCTLAYEKLPETSYSYAVLSLDSECPAGSYQVTRYHDTEDELGGRHNQPTSTYIWPSVVGRDATLKYCYVPNQRGSTLMYPVSTKYGIFAGPRANLGKENSIATSQIYIKDESIMNENEWNIKSIPTHLQSAFQNIMNGSNFTVYNMIKWIGTSLKKSAAEVAESPISAENSLVAAMPYAPAIKGLTRSAVAVELKSEGNVKVSIVDVKGSVIANIAQENLQPGVHQVKWNSGMIPSGRYIVKVEQNGMVNAKNVILK